MMLNLTGLSRNPMNPKSSKQNQKREAEEVYRDGERNAALAIADAKESVGEPPLKPGRTGHIDHQDRHI